MDLQQFIQMPRKSECLPNIGNTCFLNSTLQSIYGVEKFRQRLIQDDFLAGETELTFWLKKLFFSMKNGSKQNKIPIIKKIISFLKQQDDQYTTNSQDDSIRFVFLIFDRIFRESKGYQIKKFFNVYYKYKCQNCNRSLKITDLVVVRWNMECSNQKCQGGNMHIELITVPIGLIILQTQKRQEKITINTVKGQQIEYQLKSEVLYSGNGSAGHYVCYRMQTGPQKKYFIYNDSNVQSQQQRKQYKSKYLIYQKINKNPSSIGQNTCKRVQNRVQSSQTTQQQTCVLTTVKKTEEKNFLNSVGNWLHQQCAIYL